MKTKERISVTMTKFHIESMNVVLTIAIGALGGSVLGLFTDTRGTILGAIVGALMFTYIEHFYPNNKGIDKKREDVGAED